MAAHNGHVGDVEAALEHGRNPLVPQVVQVQVGDAEGLARLGEVLADRLDVQGEDARVFRHGLALHDGP
jgi:hypothetical protein